MPPRGEPSPGAKLLLDPQAMDQQREAAMRQQLDRQREALRQRDPSVVARLAAMSLVLDGGERVRLEGELWRTPYAITWPDIDITCLAGKMPVTLRHESAWLHYLERADGQPLAGRWVNLREIGGVFYQDAFQGYAGDELAAAWGADRDGFVRRCRALGGWEVRGLADVAFEWPALPRLPLCVCYRQPAGEVAAWATVLFDASAGHYVAADVAAILGKDLVERLKPDQRDGSRREADRP